MRRHSAFATSPLARLGHATSHLRPSLLKIGEDEGQHILVQRPGARVPAAAAAQALVSSSIVTSSSQRMPVSLLLRWLRRPRSNSSVAALLAASSLRGQLLPASLLIFHICFEILLPPSNSGFELEILKCGDSIVDQSGSSYLHRVGRTARAGREGYAVTFLTDDDRSLLKAIVCLSCLVPHATCRILFELLVLTGAQVGMDWTTILKKRNEFRVAFVEFDAESVSKFTEKQMVSISVELKLDLGRVRGISLSILKQN
ncbi:hypothetical protein ZIOFF_064744 [Zingiber officinale]|uniref:Uncharacterized protein n=1 Tax=Zingiber officinale TaxID=94328 RepID=A0A8J5EWD4_ZINOF|nr:hypothetical protein ZIOFF_064744 [Zingiber officinale]